MIPSSANRLVIGERLGFIQEYLQEIRALPLTNPAVHSHDRWNMAAAESYLRRALEALLDTGRHIGAKAYGSPATEYKQIAIKLREYKVLTQEESNFLFAMAGYRNRMVHFYHEVTSEELYTICTTQLGGIERVADAYRRWVNANPQLVSDEL